MLPIYMKTSLDRVGLKDFQRLRGVGKRITSHTKFTTEAVII